jgi:cold shock CspA family protein
MGTFQSELAPHTRIQGAVRRLMPNGCGFIAGDDGQDYFFHWSGMLPDSIDFRQLTVRDRLEFNVVPGRDGTTKNKAVAIKNLTNGKAQPTESKSLS